MDRVGPVTSGIWQKALGPQRYLTDSNQHRNQKQSNNRQEPPYDPAWKRLDLRYCPTVQYEKLCLPHRLSKVLRGQVGDVGLMAQPPRDPWQAPQCKHRLKQDG